MTFLYVQKRRKLLAKQLMSLRIEVNPVGLLGGRGPNKYEK